jgi:hypothetical protein
VRASTASSRTRTGASSKVARISTALPTDRKSWRSNEDPRYRIPTEQGDVDRRLKAVDLPPVRVTLNLGVEYTDSHLIVADNLPGEQNRPRHTYPETGKPPSETARRTGSSRPNRSMSIPIVVLSPPGITKPLRPTSSSGPTNSSNGGAKRGKHTTVSFEVTLVGDNPDNGFASHSVRDCPARPTTGAAPTSRGRRSALQQALPKR